MCLFLGQEGYNRARCKQALVEASSSPLERFDAGETNLAAILDDARAMSLFSSERLMFIGNAEAAMPRGRAAAAAAAEEEADDSDEGSGNSAAKNADLLTAYVKDPTPGVTLIVEASRWDFEGEDKAKNERVRKFFGAITEVVEFRCFDNASARTELDRIAKTLKVTIEPAAAEALVEALAADVNRISVELEKLALYGKPITAAELPTLVPDARESTIFALVNALGRRDRSGALTALDALVREGEYLPLALSFLATQFRMALATKEANLRGAGMVQGHFQKMGIPMWGSRADQVWLTASKFTKAQMEKGLKLIFEADRDLRSARPDDRVVMESFVMKLCS